ncbi:unnamed protein product [Rotaria magnacalcarata]|uniref:Mutator-like transposase domain-containing protein n=3 Tax=Rotaria magnacalcarata TaxID=392030 RepID=A0A816ZXI7_9BILA|nr:unnamed protein product [Rotaria magnacalcarata]
MKVSSKIINSNAHNTNKLKHNLITNANETSNNHEYFTYTQRSFTGPSYQKLTGFLEKTTTTTNINGDMNDHYQIIHNRFLLQLMQQTICITCKSLWDGNISVVQREGLYSSILFTCRCSEQIKINTSKQCPNAGRRDVNIRSAVGKTSSYTIVTDKFTLHVGANFVGIGYQGLAKLCAVLNLPPPLDEDHFSRTIKYVLPFFESYKFNSMKRAVEEACVHANDHNITVSGDGSWQKRGFASLHGIVAVMSNCSESKVLDLKRMSKMCSICTGLLSIKVSDENKYLNLKANHECELNHRGSSGSMEVEGIYNLFSRSQTKYNSVIDISVLAMRRLCTKLLHNPPYDDVSIIKIEDINHFSKKMLHRLEKITKDLKTTRIGGKLGIGGHGRLTKEMTIRFKQYYRQAISKNKTDLDEMIRAVWSIWRHKASSNLEPHHEWCSLSFCGYLKSLETGNKTNIYFDFVLYVTRIGDEYDHDGHKLPLAVMKAIRPVFDELAHPDTLRKVINGSSQNANESFHSVLWKFAPKNRYSSGAVIDLCAALAVLSYNDGNQSIVPVIAEMTGGDGGFYTHIGMKRFDEKRIYREHNQKRGKVNKSIITTVTSTLQLENLMIVDNNNQEQFDDSYIPRAY